jgi:molybdate transport system ATP-binding protein
MDAVRQCLEDHSLWGLRDVRVTNLSGGQRQQVALLRTMLLRPNIFLLDEPMNAFDSGAQMAVRQEIKTLIRSTGTPCLIVTHDVADAIGLGDSACLLDRGLIVRSGRPDEVVACVGMTPPASPPSWKAPVPSAMKRRIPFLSPRRERINNDPEAEE